MALTGQGSAVCTVGGYSSGCLFNGGQSWVGRSGQQKRMRDLLSIKIISVYLLV